MKNNQHGFFDKIQLDSDGNVKVAIEVTSGGEYKPGDKYTFFRDIELTPEGCLKIIIYR